MFRRNIVRELVGTLKSENVPVGQKHDIYNTEWTGKNSIDGSKQRSHFVLRKANQ